MLKALSDLSNESYQGKRVFLRADLNVPIQAGEITGDYRIRKVLPTLEYLTDKGAKVILASHLGRPRGRIVKEMSLRPVADRLSKLLTSPVKFIEESVGRTVESAAMSLKEGEILLLENLRFHKGEEENHPEFSEKLSSLGEIYVNDAFGTSHRRHASIYGMVASFHHKVAGIGLNIELKYLKKVKENPRKPFIVIIGGSKVYDKILALENLLPKADKVLLGGGIAYTFLRAQGTKVGNSLSDQGSAIWAKKTLSLHHARIAVPEDHVIAKDLNDVKSIQNISGDIPEGWTGFDIGLKTTCKYVDIISESNGTVFWNGPLGVFERNDFSNGTRHIARSIAEANSNGAITVIGGGDTVSALLDAGVKENEVTHISTGGGASMEFLGSRELPGLKVLEST